MEKIKKVLLTIVFTILLLSVQIFMVWYFFLSTTTKTQLNDYNKRRSSYYASAEVLPDIDKLPTYEDIYYQYRVKKYIFSKAESMILVVKYDKATYELEKMKLEEMKFLDHVVLAMSPNYYLMPEFEFTINSFNFRVLELDKSFGYPEEFCIIATSDEKSSIAYLYFYKKDLDYIGEVDEEDAMKKFINEYYKYDW